MKKKTKDKMAKKNEYMTREMVERDYLSKEKLVVITGMALLFGVFIISGIMISITLVNIGEDCDSDAYICPPELDSFLDTLLFFSVIITIALFVIGIVLILQIWHSHDEF